MIRGYEILLYEIKYGEKMRVHLDFPLQERSQLTEMQPMWKNLRKLPYQVIKQSFGYDIYYVHLKRDQSEYFLNV